MLKSSLLAAGLYFVVANPVTYDIVEKVFGSLVTVKNMGGATQIGTAIHAAVYGLLTYLIMFLINRRASATFEKI